MYTMNIINQSITETMWRPYVDLLSVTECQHNSPLYETSQWALHVDCNTDDDPPQA